MSNTSDDHQSSDEREEPTPVFESDDATVVLDDDGVTTRHEDVRVLVYNAWVIIQDLGEETIIPRERVEEVFYRP